MLDVAAGNGNVSLAAARRWCDVVSTDYVPSLLERGRARASADGLAIEFREADAESLPFADGAFDAVVSTFGVMVHAQSGPSRRRTAARLQIRRQDRSRKLDPGRLCRTNLQDHWKIRPAPDRGKIAGALGNACASR